MTAPTPTGSARCDRCGTRSQIAIDACRESMCPAPQTHTRLPAQPPAPSEPSDESLRAQAFYDCVRAKSRVIEEAPPAPSRETGEDAQRYDLSLLFCTPHMRASSHGEYVRYSDHADAVVRAARLAALPAAQPTAKERCPMRDPACRGGTRHYSCQAHPPAAQPTPDIAALLDRYEDASTRLGGITLTFGRREATGAEVTALVSAQREARNAIDRALDTAAPPTPEEMEAMPAVREMRRSLMAIGLEVRPSIAGDMTRLFDAVVSALAAGNRQEETT